MTDAHVPTTARWSVAKREMRRERVWIAVSAVFVLISTAGHAAVAPVIQYAIDQGVGAGDVDVVRTAAIGLVLLAIVGGVAGGLRTSLLARTGQRILHRVRVEAISGLVRKPLAEFEHQRRGDLVARVTSDVDKLGRVVSEAIPFAVADVVSVVAALLGLFFVSPVIALLSLLVIPPMAVAGHWLQQRAGTVYAGERSAIGASTGEMSETLEGVVTVKAFGRQQHRMARLGGTNAVAIDATLAGMRMRNRFSIAVTTAQALVTAVITIVVGVVAAGATITVGAASAGLLALGGVYAPLSNLLEWIDELQSGGAALDRVVALIDSPQHPPGTSDPTRSPPLDPSNAIEFDAVSFEYEAGVPVLGDVTFTVGHHQHIALVGDTGAGKSTIARLVAGLAAPDRGFVRVAGDRPPILAVQEGFLVAGTIADNLRLVEPSADAAAMRRAFQRLGASELLDRRPAGLEASASDLSAGEAQLVNLARIVLIDPAIVVLDEATSVLDAATERLVGEALDRTLAGRTVLVIAHRAATAERCDRTLRIDHGRLTESAERASAATAENGVVGNIQSLY